MLDLVVDHIQQRHQPIVLLEKSAFRWKAFPLTTSPVDGKDLKHVRRETWPIAQRTVTVILRAIESFTVERSGLFQPIDGPR